MWVVIILRNYWDMPKSNLLKHKREDIERILMDLCKVETWEIRNHREAKGIFTHYARKIVELDDKYKQTRFMEFSWGEVIGWALTVICFVFIVYLSLVASGSN